MESHVVANNGLQRIETSTVSNLGITGEIVGNVLHNSIICNILINMVFYTNS
jgi:hypothetical protein